MKQLRKRTGEKHLARLKRRRRIRGKISGTPERPRLVVFRSNKHVYAQVVDDRLHRVLLQSSSVSKELKLKKGTDQDAASHVGADLAKKASVLKIKKVVFDKGGYKYHGRVKALAEAARKGGLAF